MRIASSYVDRSELSLELEEKLHEGENETDDPSGLLIHGLGGTGKTQLALRYVEKHRNSYDPVLWIDAKDPEAVRSNFVRCADELRLPMDPAHKAGTDLADFRLIRWLEARKSTNKGFLVVFDNADSFFPELKKVVPRAGHGSVIIISQDSSASELTAELFAKHEELRVDIMKPLEARAVLLQRLKLEYNSTPLHIQQMCDDIARMLGYLVLAVDLAGAYIRMEAKLGTDLETALMQYIEDFGRHQDDLLQQDEYPGLSETDKTVWTVWDKSLNRIQDLDPGRKYRPDVLLAFLSYFRGSIVQDQLFRLASLGFPLIQDYFCEEVESLPAWLKAWTELKEDQWDDYHYRKACDLLVRYSLIQRSDEEWPGLTIHRLVQWRASMYEKDQPWEVWFLVFFTAICHQSLEDSDKPHFQRYIIPHLSTGSTLEMAIEGFSENQKALTKLSIGTVYLREGRYKEAEELLRQSSALSKSVSGEEHPNTLASMAALASTYHSQGRWKEAEELQVEVMEITKRVCGEENHHTLIRMSSLALIYSEQGRWKEAEELEVRVIEISGRLLGEEHPDTLNSMAGLASTYRSQGRCKESEELHVRVMETKKRVLGEEHRHTLISMAHLPSIYRGQGRWKEAEDLEVRLMETMKRMLGEEHPDTLSSMANLASTWKAQGQDTKAITLIKKCIRLRSQILGVDHPDTLSSSALLAKWQYFTAKGFENTIKGSCECPQIIKTNTTYVITTFPFLFNIGFSLQQYLYHLLVNTN